MFAVRLQLGKVCGVCGRAAMSVQAENLLSYKWRPICLFGLRVKSGFTSLGRQGEKLNTTISYGHLFVPIMCRNERI